MTFNDIKILWHKSTSAKKYGFWICIRNYSPKRGQAQRKTMINFFEQGLGPINAKWQYQKISDGDYILKLDNEKDFLFFLLRLK